MYRHYTVNRKVLSVALERFRPLSAKQFAVSFADGKLLLDAKSPDTRVKIETSVPCVASETGETPPDVVLPMRLWASVLKALPDESLTVSVEDKASTSEALPLSVSLRAADGKRKYRSTFGAYRYVQETLIPAEVSRKVANLPGKALRDALLVPMASRASVKKDTASDEIYAGIRLVLERNTLAIVGTDGVQAGLSVRALPDMVAAAIDVTLPALWSQAIRSTFRSTEQVEVRRTNDTLLVSSDSSAVAVVLQPPAPRDGEARHRFSPEFVARRFGGLLGGRRLGVEAMAWKRHIGRACLFVGNDMGTWPVHVTLERGEVLLAARQSTATYRWHGSVEVLDCEFTTALPASDMTAPGVFVESAPTTALDCKRIKRGMASFGGTVTVGLHFDSHQVMSLPEMPDRDVYAFVARSGKDMNYDLFALLPLKRYW